MISACAVGAWSGAALGQEDEKESAPVTAACSLGDHAGVDDADARTAASLVCAQVAKQGPAAGVTYRITLGKLGRKVVLGATVESGGAVRDARQVELEGIEEVPVAAPRLAEAIVHGSAIEDTQRVDNIVGEEARVPKKKPGSTHFALGLIGVLPPLGDSANPAPGVAMDVHYETTAFAIGGDLRIASRSGDDHSELTFGGLSIGGRYFLSDHDISPYLGAGMAWTGMSYRSPGGSYGNDSASGFGAFADVGIEMLRSHHAHLALDARLDLPFYSIHQTGVSVLDSSGVTTTGASSTRYYAPLTIGLMLTF